MMGADAPEININKKKMSSPEKKPKRLHFSYHTGKKAQKNGPSKRSQIKKNGCPVPVKKPKKYEKSTTDKEE